MIKFSKIIVQNIMSIEYNYKKQKAENNIRIHVVIILLVLLKLDMKESTNSQLNSFFFF